MTHLQNCRLFQMLLKPAGFGERTNPQRCVASAAPFDAFDAANKPFPRFSHLKRIALAAAFAAALGTASGEALAQPLHDETTPTAETEQRASARGDQDAAEALEALRVRSLKGAFREEKTIAGFPKPMVSTGRFELSPGRLIWRIEDPFPSITTIDEHGIRFSDGLDESVPPEGGQAGNAVDVNPQAAQTAKILTGLLSGDPAALSALFDVKRLPSVDGKLLLEATPKDGALSQFIRKAVFAGREYVEDVRLEGAGGDITRIRFSDVEVLK